MVSHLFFYQWVLLALVWLFLVLPYAWPREHAKRPQSAARVPLKRKPPRAQEPQPFVGLIQRPPCARCEREAPPPPPPPPIPPTPGRRPTDGHAPWPLRGTSVPRPAGAIAAGEGSGTCVPTAIPAV